MLAVLLQPTYRTLFAAHVVALLGTGLATIALGFLAFDVGGSDAGIVLGILFAIKMGAYIFIAPLASAVLARFDTRLVLITCDVVRALGAAALLFVTEVGQAYVLVIVLQCASAVFTPVFQSTIPSILPEERDYTNALALSRLAYDLELLLAPALAGLLLLAFSSSSLFLGTAIGFAASVALLLSVRLPKSGRRAEPGRFTERLTRGTRLMLTSPPMRALLALHLTVAATGAFVFVQTVVIVRANLGQPEWMVTLVLGAFGLGSICAAFLMPRLIDRLGERRYMLLGATLLTVPLPFVIVVVAVPTEIGAVALLGLWFVMGLGYSGVLAPTGRVIRRHTLADDLPTVFAAQFSLAHGWWLISYPLAGWLGATFGLGVAAICLAVIAALATAAAVALWKPVPVAAAA